MTEITVEKVREARQRLEQRERQIAQENFERGESAARQDLRDAMTALTERTLQAENYAGIMELERDEALAHLAECEQEREALRDGGE